MGTTILDVAASPAGVPIVVGGAMQADGARAGFLAQIAAVGAV